MAETSSSSSGGIGFAGALTIAFIVLKLTHVINWSWWWVLSPLWISWAILGVVLLLFGIGFLIYTLVTDRKTARRRTQYSGARRYPRG